ncbi:MAG: Crp/Fnr family transcriptional regulator [Janthinobacterium lividum]
MDPEPIVSDVRSFEVQSFLASTGIGKSILPFQKGSGIFAQGDSCEAIFYLQEGTVKLTVLSEQGKEATIALLSGGDFVGEECVATFQPFRSATATAFTNCTLLRIRTSEMQRVLRDEPQMSAAFVAYLLARTGRIQADLVDHLFNSAEKRLARTLLLLSNFCAEEPIETLVPQISQETLAAMIGCTRSRVSTFLNRFRKLGYIEYADRIRVNKGLLQVIHNE